MIKANSISGWVPKKIENPKLDPISEEGCTFKESMESIEWSILSHYENSLQDLRPTHAVATFESMLGDGMQLNGAPLFTRHSSPMDTELEINLMDELCEAFHLP